MYNTLVDIPVSNKLITPFKAYKVWTLDTGSGITVLDAVYTPGSFVSTAPTNSNGMYKGAVFNHIRNNFIRKFYSDPVSTNANTFGYNENRYHYDQYWVLSITGSRIGEGIRPGSVTLTINDYSNAGASTFTMIDDKNGNLLLSTASLVGTGSITASANTILYNSYMYPKVQLNFFELYKNINSTIAYEGIQNYSPIQITGFYNNISSYRGSGSANYTLTFPNTGSYARIYDNPYMSPDTADNIIISTKISIPVDILTTTFTGSAVIFAKHGLRRVRNVLPGVNYTGTLATAWNNFTDITDIDKYPYKLSYVVTSASSQHYIQFSRYDGTSLVSCSVLLSNLSPIELDTNYKYYDIHLYATSGTMGMIYNSTVSQSINYNIQSCKNHSDIFFGMDGDNSNPLTISSSTSKNIGLSYFNYINYGADSGSLTTYINDLVYNHFATVPNSAYYGTIDYSKGIAILYKNNTLFSTASYTNGIYPDFTLSASLATALTLNNSNIPIGNYDTVVYNNKNVNFINTTTTGSYGPLISYSPIILSYTCSVNYTNAVSGSIIQPQIWLYERHPNSTVTATINTATATVSNSGSLIISGTFTPTSSATYFYNIQLGAGTPSAVSFSNLQYIVNQSPAPDGKYSSSTIPVNVIGGYNFGSLQLQYQSTKTVVEHEYICTVSPSDLNYSTNKTLAAADGVTYLPFVNSGSSFTPYITTVGLYDTYGHLLAIGKLSKPVPKSTTMDTTFVVKFDM